MPSPLPAAVTPTFPNGIESTKMSSTEALFLAWSLGVVQVLGVASAFFVRISAGRSVEPLAQRSYLGCLALMGMVTIGAFYLGPGYWLMAATTLASMILIATCDFGEERQSTAYRSRQ